MSYAPVSIQACADYEEATVRQSMGLVLRQMDALNFVRPGMTVAVKVNLGRNKSVSYSGVLSGIYPALFTVKPDDKDFLGKTAYSYSDVLCGNVKIKRL